MRFLARLAALAVVFAVIGTVAYRHILRLQSEATEFTRAVMPAVFNRWDSMALYERASPDFKATSTLDQVYNNFRGGSALGRLERFDEPQVGARVFYAIGKGLIRSAAVKTRAEFERGEADILMEVVKLDGRWYIQTLRYNASNVPNAEGAAATVSASGQRSGGMNTEEAQREAVRRYPEIGVRGTKLNQAFIARQKQYQSSRPEFFNDPTWPLRLAEEVAKSTPPK